MSILEGMVAVVVVLYSVILHELSHGLMAKSLGDDTAERSGRLTLNPFPHLDLFGSVLLPLITYNLGGFIFGYAKPVPHNPLNLRDQRYGSAKVAAAGPLSNILLALLFGFTMRFFSDALPLEITHIFSFIVRLNLVLAVFNLVPIPPLDGHWLLLTFLPARFAQFKYFLMRYGIFIFIIFLLFFFQFLIPLIDFLFRAIVGTAL